MFYKNKFNKLELGKVSQVLISGSNRQDVINAANEYCEDNKGYKIWYDACKEFRFFRMKWEYRIGLYKPIDIEIIDKLDKK